MFKIAHNNLNVMDLEKSLAFYKEAINLTEVRRLDNPIFTVVFLGDGATTHFLELTY